MAVACTYMYIVYSNIMSRYEHVIYADDCAPKIWMSDSRPHGHPLARTYFRMNYGLLLQERTDARRAISGN